jgi:hypothetical protein
MEKIIVEMQKKTDDKMRLYSIIIEVFDGGGLILVKFLKMMNIYLLRNGLVMLL